MAAQGITEDELLKLCAQAELNSTHPIAVSIVNAAKEKGLELNMPESVQEIAGKGLIVKGGDGELLCGNRLLLEEHQVNVPGIKEEQCGTEVFAAQNGVFIGRILIGDTVKEDAYDTVSYLKRHGVRTAMLTGDSERNAKQWRMSLESTWYMQGSFRKKS